MVGLNNLPMNYTNQSHVNPEKKVIVNHIDEIWSSDFVEMQQFSKWNKGYRYLLLVLDMFSEYGWIVPLKDKKKVKLLQKRLKKYLRKVENHNIFGQVRVKNTTIST